MRSKEACGGATARCLIVSLPRWLVAAAVVSVLAVAGCSGDDEHEGSAPSLDRSTASDGSGTTEFALSERDGPRRGRTGSVPHVQLDAEPVADVDAELRRRLFKLPGVQDLPSERSLPGARGLALSGELDLARPDVIDGSREFAHIHPDGSLHVWAPVDLALAVHDTNWGEIHPWVDRDGFWDGVVMLFTPETLDELETTIWVVVEAYNFVTGASLTPADIT